MKRRAVRELTRRALLVNLLSLISTVVAYCGGLNFSNRKFPKGFHAVDKDSRSWAVSKTLMTHVLKYDPAPSKW
jgi:hypothetical protein